MDGTLVDSEKVWDVAIGELVARYGATLSLDARRAMVGTGTIESMEILHAALEQPWRDVEAGAVWLEDRVAHLFAEGLVWRPGAVALISAVREAGIPTALVTSTCRRLVDVALPTLGPENFDVVVCGDEVGATKPNPEPYRTAARLLGVPVDRCVAIEDSPTGVASAVAAGVAVVAVPCEVALAPQDGVLVLDSLTRVDLALLGRLANRVDHAEVVPDSP